MDKKEKKYISKKEFSRLKKESMESLVKVDKHIYLQHFKAPYSLDKLLNRGCSNVVDLINFVYTEMAVHKRFIYGTVGGFACTTFDAFKEDGSHLLARNFDYKDSPLLAYWSTPENGYKSIALTSMNLMFYGYNHQLIDTHKKSRTVLAPYTCMDGMNEKGLAIAVLEIRATPTKQITGRRPIITTVALRAVLDKCATVDEAIELFKSYDMHDILYHNYHFHIVDASGRSVVIEYVNNEMKVIEKEEKNQYAMNFYLSPQGDNSKGYGYERRDVVIAALSKTDGEMNELECMDVLSNCLVNYKHDMGYMMNTIWSVVYNCEEKSVTLVGGSDFEHIYKLSLEKPCQVERIEK